MAKRKGDSAKPTPNFEKPRGGCRPVWGSIFLLLAILSLVALFHFEPNQSHRYTTDPTSDNLVGLFGVEFAWWSFSILGGAGWLLPAIAFYFSYMLFCFPRRLDFIKIGAVIVCVLAAASLSSMQERLFTDPDVYRRGPGGAVGGVLYDNLLQTNLGVFGSALLLSLVCSLGILLLCTSNMSEAFQKFFFHFGEWKKERQTRRLALQETRAKERAEQKALREKERAARLAEKEKEREQKRAEKTARKLTAKERLEQELDSGEPIEVAAPAIPAPAPRIKAAPREKVMALPKREPKEDDGEISLPLASQPRAAAAPAATATLTDPVKPRIIKSEMLKKATIQPPKIRGDYRFPPIDLLARPEPIAIDDRENHEETAQALIHTLKTFGIVATVDEIHVGPVITRFDILPAPGTKVSKIQGLENDIAMGLKALAVRILAPVPGKGCVGVEIPNRQPQPVSLREIIESEDWNNSRAEIPIGLGKDVSGRPLVADLTKMPHLLIAGSTGSGKTVCINSIIASLLYHASPEQLRFIMVDPKIVEMKVFNDLPHMLIPVVTEPKKVPGALKWLLNEMERRYQLFASIGVRNIAGFHAFSKKEAQREAEEAAAAALEPNEVDGNLPEAVAPEIEVPRDEVMEIPKTLPYIVCIIDELADLMMVAPAEIETGIARLAQLARAAGIHLILATQRPSVNVITGVIKANLPSRIAFKVASKVDSRTILDGMGADQLIGRGDMLFLPPGSARLLRSQGAFVSDDEITGIVEFLKTNGPPQFAEDVQRQIDADDEEDGGDGFAGGEDEDDMFQDALDVLRSTKRASTSMLQRRLRIGYNRAARIMEIMEQRGIVGPENGSSPREILVDLDSM
jgi:DNA segregation ATPase FtsK/SpoIIIE, S-DNA-T family